jgi:hypothetical protein
VLGLSVGSGMFQSGAARRHLRDHFVDELGIHPFANEIRMPHREFEKRQGGADAVYRKARKCIQHAFDRFGSIFSVDY